MFELELELKKRDYISWYLFDFCTNFRDVFFSCTLCLFLMFFCIIMIFVIFEGTLLFILMPIVALLTIFLGCMFKFLAWNDLANYYGNSQLNKYKLIFNENEFFDESRLEKKQYKATAIIRVADTKHYLLLYQTKRSAWIIPKLQLKNNDYDSIMNFLSSNNIPVKKHSWL